MKLWMGAEFSGDIHPEIREARNFLVDEINKIIEHKNYQIELDKIRCIPIIMEEGNYSETYRYSKRKQAVDVRLNIDYKKFKDSSLLERQILLFDILQRALKRISEEKLNKNGLHALRSDIAGVGKKHGWV